MPIYEVKVPGQVKPRMIKAKDVSAALAGIVDVKAISAERMTELIEDGVKLEKIADASDPASHAPGGWLHDPSGGHGDKDKGGDDAGKSGEQGKPAGK